MGLFGLTDYPSHVGAAWSTFDRWQPSDRRVLARGLQDDLATWQSLATVMRLTPQVQALLESRASRTGSGSVAAEDTVHLFVLDKRLSSSIDAAIDGLVPHLGRVRLYKWEQVRKRELKADAKTATDVKDESGGVDDS